jgi:hypothetical protein
MKQRLLLLILAALGLSSCAGPPPPDADFKALRKQLLSVPPLVPLLLIFLLLASCTNRPFAILADGTKVSVGQSAVTKTGTEASVAEVVTKTGDKIRLTYTSTGLDETSLPGAYFGFKTTKVLADDATQAANVTQRQITKRGTVLSTKSADGSTSQSVSYPPQPANAPALPTTAAP